MKPGAKGALAKTFGSPSLWPLWAILLIGAVLLLGRGCAPGAAQRPSAAATTTVTKTVTVPATARGGSSAATALSGEPARGPAGAPVTATERSVARCDIDRLPTEARRTVDLVTAGGPFPYPRNDGVVFRNAERLLPAKPANYYREYTVDTPQEDSRGARRIVTGGGSARAPEQWYYTNDHYQSFCQITGLP
ncbi:MAG: guanyl-specific ribonuclease [Actinobacteria bacterium]|nr:guanyl-specific ribonuclease [Actinomycetota bacterium]